MSPSEAFGHPKKSLFWSTGKLIEGRVRCLTRPARDRVANWRSVRRSRQRFAVFRHPAGLPSYYQSFLDWLAVELPEVRSRLELQLLPCRIRNWSRYALVLPWIPDTLLYRSSRARREACVLTTLADSHHVPIINPPPRLLSTSKFDGAERIARFGVRTPRTRLIEDRAGFRHDLSGLEPPLLVREDLAHGGWSPVFLVREPRDTMRIPLEQFERPIAMEFIDVRDPHDQLVRKYRYLAAGDLGIAHTLQISQHWEVRGRARLLNSSTRAEEIAYCAEPDPNHEAFQRVRRGLGLDFLAIDYSYDRQRKPVIWEINILPGLGLPQGPDREYLHPIVARSMAATAKMWLLRAGLEIPQKVDDLLGESVSDSFRFAA